MKPNFLALLSVFLALPLVGCGFSKQVREESAAITPIVKDSLLMGAVASTWVRDSLKAYKNAQVQKAMAQNPTLDPATIRVTFPVEKVIEEKDATTGIVNKKIITVQEPIDDLISAFDANIEDAMKLTELMDLLNEQIQANQGVKPFTGEILNLAKSPEFQAMVRTYWEMYKYKK